MSSESAFRGGGAAPSPDQETLKREIYDRMNPRRRAFVDRVGYDAWDPFQKPNDPMDLRTDESGRTARRLFLEFMRSRGGSGSDAFRQGAFECAAGLVAGDERCLGMYEFCAWRRALLKKEGLLDDEDAARRS